MNHIDAKGKACPMPVMLAKKEMETGCDALSITVDNAIAVQNLTRLAESQGFSAETAEEAGGCFTITMHRTGAPVSEAPAEILSCTVPADLVPGEYILAAVKGNSVLGHIMVNVVSEAGGVSDIIVDEAAGEAVYYDMQGRRVTGTPAPGVYLRRTPAAVTKVVVK